jgi:hypothetical protein
MFTSRPYRAALLCSFTLAAAGCETGTSPEADAPFDTEAALADYEALSTALGSSDLAGFQALGGRTSLSSAATALAAVEGLTTAEPGDDGRRFALRLAEGLRNAVAEVEAGGPAATPIISRFHRGSTFVFDPASDDYRVDPDRAGAPATGVRFIIYAVDEAGTPILAEETGYADLVDEGDGSAEDIVLHLTVVHMEDTVLDYRTTLDVDVGGGALTVGGFLFGDGVRLDFDLELAARESGESTLLDITFDLRVDARDFSIAGAVQGIEENDEGEGEIDITVRHRADSIRVDVHGVSGTLEGTIYVNEAIFATVSGPADDPTFVGAAGQALTWGEFLVLRQIFDTVEDVFDFVEDLVDPVDELIILGIIL